MDIELVPALDSDRHYFENLSELVYREIFEHQIGPWDSALEQEKFDQKWQEQNFKKIYLRGELIGGIWVQEFDSHYQLREIQIHPDYQSRGVGTKLLSDLIERCTAQRTELRLRVLKSSPARKLYERLGFEVRGQNDNQYCMVYAS